MVANGEITPVEMMSFLGDSMTAYHIFRKMNMHKQSPIFRDIWYLREKSAAFFWGRYSDGIHSPRMGECLECLKVDHGGSPSTEIWLTD